MSGSYFVTADQGQGARWSFTEEQLTRAAAEIHPGAEVAGPFDPHGMYEITLRSPAGWKHSVTWQSEHMAFSFTEEDEIDITAGFVLQVLRRFAPEAPAIWVADFVGNTHPFRPADLTPDEFVHKIRTET